MFNRTWLCAGVAATMFSVVGAANAAVTQLTSLVAGSTVNLANPTSTSTDADTFALGTNIVTLYSTNGIELGTGGSYGDSNFASTMPLAAECGYAGYGGCSVPGALTIVFSNPVHSFTVSADDFDFSGPYTFTLTALDLAGDILGSFTASSYADQALASDVAVLAGTSSVGVSYLLVTDAPSPGSSGTADGDFVVGAIGVPEPSSIALFSIALLALFGLARRRV